VTLPKTAAAAPVPPQPGPDAPTRSCWPRPSPCAPWRARAQRPGGAFTGLNRFDRDSTRLRAVSTDSKAGGRAEPGPPRGRRGALCLRRARLLGWDSARRRRPRLLPSRRAESRKHAPLLLVSIAIGRHKDKCKGVCFLDVRGGGPGARARMHSELWPVVATTASRSPTAATGPDSLRIPRGRGAARVSEESPRSPRAAALRRASAHLMVIHQMVIHQMG
jgi:hypothetical protein